MKTKPTDPTTRPESPDTWIRERAYYLWLERGCPEGEALQDWLAATAEFAARPAAAATYPEDKYTPETFSIRHTIDQHESDPTHRFHSPAVAHDSRLNVAANEAPQRIRGRHFENAERKPGKKG
jgi:hypothetical protein